MFKVDYTTGAITMSVGDTGSFQVEAHRDDETDWTEDDRATLTIKNAEGSIVLERDYRLDDDEGLGNGVIGIEFQNSDTDTWNPGIYSWEMRYIVNPYYDSNGKIIDGDIVRTPGIDGGGDPMPMILKAVYRNI